MTHRLLPALALALPLSLAACSPSVPAFELTNGGMSAESDRHGVSGGGFRVAFGEPVLFFGSMVENDVRSYTYLVIGRDVVRNDTKFEQVGWGTSTADADELSSDCDLMVDGTSFEADFTARIDGATVVDRQLTMNGRAIEDGTWLFLYDANEPGKGLVAVQREMPDLPRDVSELGDFTIEYVRQLVSEDESFASFAGR